MISGVELKLSNVISCVLDATVVKSNDSVFVVTSLTVDLYGV